MCDLRNRIRSVKGLIYKAHKYANDIIYGRGDTAETLTFSEVRKLDILDRYCHAQQKRLKALQKDLPPVESKKVGLSPEGRKLLLFIKESPSGQARIKDIIKRLNLTQSVADAHLRGFFINGLIVFKNRVKIIDGYSITEKGEACLKANESL